MVGNAFITDGKYLDHLHRWLILTTYSERPSLLICGELDSKIFRSLLTCFQSISAVLIGWWSDKEQKRAPFIAGQGIMSLVGLIMTAFAHSSVVRYLGAFFFHESCSILCAY